MEIRTTAAYDERPPSAPEASATQGRAEQNATGRWARRKVGEAIEDVSERIKGGNNG
jgi:hypothetical protein